LIQLYVNRFSEQFINRKQVDSEKIKKREEEIKNTKNYTGSPFLKGYVQSFVN